MKKLLAFVQFHVRAFAIRRLGIKLTAIPAHQAKLISTLLKRVHPRKSIAPLIRVGGNGDGGYLIPDDLAGISYCFSPGVSLTANFELELADRGIHSFLADYSVDSPPMKHEKFSFIKKFLGAVESETHTTLDHWVSDQQLNPAADLILQMDIEGWEYEVLLSASEAVLARFRIAVIEFHHMDALFTPAGYFLISTVFERLLKIFEVVHIHPNNVISPFILEPGVFIPPLLEFTFLRKDRFSDLGYVREFPHPLDQGNLTTEPDFPLPKGWFLPAAAGLNPEQ